MDISIIQSRVIGKPSKLDIILKGVLAYILILLAILWGVVYFSTLCRVQGDSMLGTLHDGDLLLLNKSSNNIHINDIVVLPYPNRADYDIIKRVVAVGDDTIRFAVDDNVDSSIVRLYRASNGVGFELVDESGYDIGIMSVEFFDDYSIPYGHYITSEIGADTVYIPSPSGRDTITIDKGYIYVLGDNRGNSTDSRQLGALQQSSVVGKMYARLVKGSLAESVFKFVYRA